MSLLAQHRAGPWGRSQQKGRIYPGARCKGQGRLASQTGHLFTDRRLCLKSKGRTGGQMGSQEGTNYLLCSLLVELHAPCICLNTA